MLFVCMVKDDHYNGIFLPSSRDFAGHLNIAGADSLVRLIGKGVWPSAETEYLDIHGFLGDGRKVSLLNCVLHGQTYKLFNQNGNIEGAFFPNYVVVGDEFLRSSDLSIRAVRYHFENVAALLKGQKTFQSLMPDVEEVRILLEAEYKRNAKVADEFNWSKPPFEPQIGENPYLLYFSGVWEIVTSNAELGRISLTNRTSHGSGSAAGISFENEVTANIEFLEPKTLSAAVRALCTLHSLFELSLGQQQRYLWIELEFTNPENDNGDQRQTARLYWSLCNERVDGDSRRDHYDTLLAPGLRPEEFAKVTAGWMDSAVTMGDPRERFATAFFENDTINRIVGAANMFDLLPESRAPKKRQFDAELNEAVVQCRKIFEPLADSPAKQSVLSALGRVGTASLRDKVIHRADRITTEIAKTFPDLTLPCKEAVLARNHYVHGSPPSFDYQEHFTEFMFLTDTLEFVFAVSDLMDLGWDLRSWMIQGLTTSHPFSAYIVNYRANILRLKALVKK